MRKLFNIWLIVLAVVLLLTGFLSWLLTTNQGAGFVLDKVIRSIPVNIETGNINGKLAGGFEIEGVVIRFQSWQISSKRLYVQWSPLHLLGGWIGIREIVIEELVFN
jgi:autotransporter translocation and assembly factor TamB